MHVYLAMNTDIAKTYSYPAAFMIISWKNDIP